MLKDAYGALLELPPERVRLVLALYDWLFTKGRFIADPNGVAAGVGKRLNEVGVPAHRISTLVRVLHSERSHIARVWSQDEPAREFMVPHGAETTDGYLRSPYKEAHDRGEWIEFKVAETADETYGVVPDLREEGYTDYICIPVTLANGAQNAYSFATKNPAGFSDDCKTVIRFVMPALEAMMEILVLRRILNEVTRIYLGEEPHQRVLSGDVRRGELMHIRSAMMFSDMRGFTSVSMKMPEAQVVDLLNHYYDCIVGPVEAHGGEVLKFIGDGILAIFRAKEDDEVNACDNAYHASVDALAEVEKLNVSGSAPAQFSIGVGLHFGDAAYGNVGSGQRQDYTVIGRDVNVTSRIAGLCGTLNKPLLVSSEIKQHLPKISFTHLGEHPLKGVERPLPVFEPG